MFNIINMIICPLYAEISLTGVIKAGAVVGGTGLLIGLLLGIAAKKLSVPTDDRAERIRELLPGSNCGGCGFAGCDACAEAIAAGNAPINACAGAKHSEIAAVMGTTAEEEEKKVAFVKCSGSCDKVSFKYNYKGIADCRKLALIPGHGEKDCIYGCMGYGSCARACPNGAIRIVDGVAKVSPDSCTGCGSCIKVCPNSLIELRPVSAKYAVACSSKDKGKDVRTKCKAGCIGCGICAKQCGAGAITVENNIAHIDYSKCTGCGKCAEKCPQKIIIKIG